VEKSGANHVKKEAEQGKIINIHKIFKYSSFFTGNICTCSKLMSFEYPRVVDKVEKGAFIGVSPVVRQT